MKLAIVRHGHAAFDSQLDFERNLTETGCGEAQSAGAWLSRQAWHNPCLWVSPYRRAQQTARWIAGASSSWSLVQLDEQGRSEHWQDEPLLIPSGSVRALTDKLATENRDLILVSHMPFVGALAAALTGSSDLADSFSTGECRVLQADIAAAGCMDEVARWSSQG